MDQQKFLSAPFSWAAGLSQLSRPNILSMKGSDQQKEYHTQVRMMKEYGIFKVMFEDREERVKK